MTWISFGIFYIYKHDDHKKRYHICYHIHVISSSKQAELRNVVARGYFQTIPGTNLTQIRGQIRQGCLGGVYYTGVQQTANVRQKGQQIKLTVWSGAQILSRHAKYPALHAHTRLANTYTYKYTHIYTVHVVSKPSPAPVLETALVVQNN